MPDTVRAGTLPPDQVDDGAQAVWARFELRARQAGLAQRFSPHDGQRTSIGNRSTPAPTSCQRRLKIDPLATVES
jgi:hypothetical protein